MNRREVLKFLALAPLASTFIAECLSLAEDAAPVNAGFSTMSCFGVFGVGDVANCADVSIFRTGKYAHGDGKLLQFYVNTLGGYLKWQATIGGEICFPGDSLPTVKCSSKNVRWYLPLDTPRGGALLSSDHAGLILLEDA